MRSDNFPAKFTSKILRICYRKSGDPGKTKEWVTVTTAKARRFTTAIARRTAIASRTAIARRNVARRNIARRYTCFQRNGCIRLHF